MEDVLGEYLQRYPHLIFELCRHNYTSAISRYCGLEILASDNITSWRRTGDR